MGRKARLRQQRRAARETQSETTPNIPQAQTVAIHAEVPALETASPEPKSKPSFLERLLPFRQSPEQASLVQSGEATEDFFDTYEVLLGAIAWQGYKSEGKGFVYAVNTPEQTVRIDYVSRKNLKQYVEPENRSAYRMLIDDYDPQAEVNFTYVTQTGDEMLGSPRTTEPSPPECYQMVQQEDWQMPTLPSSESSEPSESSESSDATDTEASS
jgi:hypothetical protein